jgi:lipopolysaccharide export system permease protein
LAKIDRYILSQLMGPFAVFALILIGIYWVARAIGLFDALIGDGQSVSAFFEIMVLFLPQVVAIVLPVVSFAAAIYVSNRLHSESEMVVLQSTGLSPGRLLRPFALFSLLVAIFASLLSHYLVPVSQTRLDRRQAELAEDMATRLIVGGRFLHPGDNLTFFVGDVANDGTLVDIFLHDRRITTRDLTYTAHRAVLIRNPSGDRLVMFDGLVQALDRDTLLLSKVQFDELVFDIASLTGSNGPQAYRMNDYSTLQALRPTPEMTEATGASAEEFIQLAHQRIEQPLQSLIYPLIGMATLMLGSFSRFGVVRQVIGAVVLVVALSTLSVPIRNAVRLDISLWPMIYVPTVLGLGLTALMLRFSVRRGRGLSGRMA